MAGREPTPGRALLAAVLAGAVVAVSGCGKDEKSVGPTPADNTQAVALVSDRDIAATRKDSPQRTVLTWWRLTQFKDVKDGLNQFTRTVRRTLIRADYPTIVVRYLGPWIRNGKPRILRVERPGFNHAVVYMETRFNVPVGTDLVRKDLDTLAMAVDREDGRWLISDGSWPLAQGNGLREAQVLGQRQQARRARR
jgi:hypothetical protein